MTSVPLPREKCVLMKFRPALSSFQCPRKRTMAKHPGPKKPPLTHFLCLPLVNAVSLPQLESSLATFKHSIPSCPRKENESTLKHPRRPLIPDSAIRPVGTLHLTLGVMSLGTKEKLDESVAFLRSLDLAGMMRDAERIANENARRGGGGGGGQGKDEVAGGEAEKPKPFVISLEALHALPRARNATVLHAVPVDRTSRLHPFCLLLQEKFLQAGILLGEPYPKGRTQQDEASASSPAAQSPPPSKQPGRRPLLLHATVVNTIYIKGRSRDNSNRNSNSNRYSFDARDIIAHYDDYYVDYTRTRPRSTTFNTLPQTGTTIGDEEEDLVQGEQDRHAPHHHPNLRVPPPSSSLRVDKIKYPFIWAKDVPLESVCICEMGARKIPVVPGLEHENALADRLGEQYRIVAERSLMF